MTEPEDKYRVCFQCDATEGEPFGVGDHCLCGGYFVEVGMIDRNYKECPVCYGAGRIQSPVITHGTSVCRQCNFCQGSGLVDVEEPEQEANP